MSKFIVNSNEVEVTENKKLLTFLREDLNLTSVKNGCSQGACGTCMILIDGVAKKACVINTDKLEGKEVITVEGLAAKEKDAFSYAFAEAGAVQCGFCTPGMVMSGKALINKTPDPTDDQIKDAIKNNICRCTGYVKIVEGIKSAAKILREDIKVEQKDTSALVGKNFNRVDAVEKTLGIAEYVDDIRIDGMVYGSAVRTKYPRALVKKIDTTEAEKLEGVLAVLTAKDLPGKKKIGHIVKDWDILIGEGEATRYIGDAIVLVAAESQEILEKAKKMVHIEYEELQPITDPKEAMKKDAPNIHEAGNILTVQKLKRGDADAVIENSKYVVRNIYKTPFTDHAFLEPESAVAMPDGEDGVIVYCADQGVYQTHKECTEALGIPADKVRVISKMVGGGFGGKEDLVVQHHAAILAYSIKKPVKVALTRDESIKVHVKRHAMEMEFITACDENGKLTAMKANIIADTGAYASLGGPVLQRACTHAAGPYNYQDIEIVGTAVYTNNPPAGPYRGFGATQSCFATENNINQLAEMVGISPWEIRYKNAIRPGQVLPNGQIASEDTALVETLEAVKDQYDANPKAGIACALKNSGLGVGIPDIGRCRIVIKDGKVHTYTSAACIGQGLATVMTQMITETTNISHDDIVHEAPDTGLAPNAGNTTASRQTLMTGEATRKAALLLKDALEGKTLVELEGQEFYEEFTYESDPIDSDKENPVSHIAYGYATHMIILDDEGKIKKAIAVHDVGTPINPKALEGQIEGGVVMSLGYALTEDFPLKDGVPTAKFGTLGLFKSTQVPEIEAIVLGKKGLEKKGAAYGAKGIGEISSIPTAPAVTLAYYNYDGKFRTSLPINNTPYEKKRKK
ncbi:selenium-dependent xanthine dehydrogenase [Clostridium sediminicola]|uniref:selenium-dependent xanthine dehydrogenase n=1 Tax=Clostridium sediminicola TaxID=3114879 RepID=UPI0031F23EF2